MGSLAMLLIWLLAIVIGVIVFKAVMGATSKNKMMQTGGGKILRVGIAVTAGIIALFIAKAILEAIKNAISPPAEAPTMYSSPKSGVPVTEQKPTSTNWLKALTTNKSDTTSKSGITAMN